MTHLFYVRFGGDEQGTVLERMVKEIVRKEYDDSACTEAAIDGIYKKLCRDCKTLWEMHPRCKAVDLRLDKPAYRGDGYRIMLVRDNNGCNCGNDALLYFRMCSSYYLTSGETPYSVVDGRELFEFADGLCAYNI